MYEKFHSCIKKRGAVAIGLAIASLSTLSTTTLAAGGFQLPEIDSVPVGQATTNGAQVQQPTPTKDSATAKIGYGLDTLHQEYLQYQASPALRAAGPFSSQQTMARVTTDNQVVIDAVATTDPQALKAQLEGLGAVVTGVAGKMVSAQLPLDQIPALSNLPGLLFARPALASTRTGSVTSQGDHAMGADTARTTFSVTGVGSTVGVLSDSYDCLGGAAANVLSNDLPAGVVVLQDACPGNADEGRAMAQIVHDVAPGAGIKFHTAFAGEANFAQGIKDLQTAGSNIIVDDVGYFAEPFFQDGVIAQAVDTVVAAGATYFSAAGNSARQSYDDAFRPSTVYAAGAFGPSFLGGTAHDFDPGAGVDNFQSITCHAGDELIITLQWDNPYPSLGGPPPAANVDFYLLNSVPNAVLARSVVAQPPNDPVEIFGGTCSSTFNANLMIVLKSGTAPTRIKYVNYGSSSVSINEYDTKSPTSVGHPNAAGAIATGASAYFLTPAYGTTPPVLNYFSSAGGVPILFLPNGTPIPGGILRAKPEITAPDGGDNTFFGGDWEPNGWPNFFGTSAAAPHAAAVAALMLHENSSLTPAAIKTTLQSTAIDILQRGGFGRPLVPIGVGFDNDSGAGFINALAAVMAVVPSPCDIDVAPLTLSFGNVTVGHNATQNVTISNTGEQACTVTGLGVSGSTDFTLGAGAPTPPFSVDSGTPVTVPVKYTPSGAGADNGTLTVSSNDTDESSVNVNMSGNGILPGGQPCDADYDGDIDRNDLSLISRARGQTPTPQDPRDANGDGRITPADVQVCIPQCTRPNCATQ